MTRKEIDVPLKPTLLEWLQVDSDNKYFNVLNEEVKKLGIDAEKGKPQPIDAFTDTSIPYGEND